MGFINLHVHDEYSVLDGFGTAKAYAARAKFLNQAALASTNHGNVDGLIKHQKACVAVGIQPILGCELYVVPNAVVKNKDETRGHMVVLVRNWEGWRALCSLLSRANLEGFYHRPRVSFSWISALSPEALGGLVFMTGCMASFLRLPGGFELAEDLAKRSRLYAEVQPYPGPEQVKWNKDVSAMAYELGVELIATNDVHYVLPDDSGSQEVLLAIHRKAKWTDPKRFKFEHPGLHLRSEREMVRAFARQAALSEEEYRGAIDRTEEIRELCPFTIPKMEISLPATKYEKDVPADKVFWRLINQGIPARFPEDWTSGHAERVEEEFRVICDKKFERYFLVVYEFINWCRENGILVGPGRGSVGGSLLAYLLEITDVNPLEYDLIFSRFINPERNDYPDIDIDIASHRRHEARLHLEEEYGLNCIAGISTFNRMKGRSVVRDVSRVFEVNLSEVDKFCKSMPESSEKTANAVQVACESEIGRGFLASYPDVVKAASRLEGQVRSSGQHPAAIVISSEDLLTCGRCVVLERDGNRVINWDMEDSEYVGLMKLDALFLDALSVIGEAADQIEANREEQLVLTQIPLNDPAVFAPLSDGRTAGVFQLSGYACKKLCRDMKIDCFNDIAAITALARPGPLNSGMAQLYVDRKHGALWEKSRHPQYARIVQDTYGVLVYQEQVMRVFTDVAGLSASTADKIRKVIGKKRDASEFEPYRVQFVEGCRTMKTFSEAEAKEFWDGLLLWAEYGFNKAHAVEYGLIAYWTAWLKYYYPVEYISSFLTYGEESQKAEVLREVRALTQLKIATPKVGVSDPRKWTVRDGFLYMPFSSIKGIGDVDAERCPSQRPADTCRLPGLFNLGKVEKSKNGTKLQQLLEEVRAFDPDPEVRPENMEELFGCEIPGLEEVCAPADYRKRSVAPEKPPERPQVRRSPEPTRVGTALALLSLPRAVSYVKVHYKEILEQAEFDNFLASVIVRDYNAMNGRTVRGKRIAPVSEMVFCKNVSNWINRDKDDDIPF